MAFNQLVLCEVKKTTGFLGHKALGTPEIMILSTGYYPNATPVYVLHKETIHDCNSRNAPLVFVAIMKDT